MITYTHNPESGFFRVYGGNKTLLGVVSTVTWEFSPMVKTIKLEDLAKIAELMEFWRDNP